MKDELELKTAAIWELESAAGLVMPAITWSKNDVSLDLAAGLFVARSRGS